MELTQSYLKSILHYDPDTGILTWKPRSPEHFASDGAWKSWTIRFAGKNVGGAWTTRSGCRYVRVKINGKTELAHRVIFCMVHGWLPEMIDHIDQNGLNNRIGNLRAADYAINAKNRRMPSNNTSGLQGVSWVKSRSKWQSQSWIAGKNCHLGYYDTPEEASAAYRKAIEAEGYSPLHGYCKA